MMQNSCITLRSGQGVCDHCGTSNKRILQHEYTCMTCGVIDQNAMIVDEVSEQRRQWENNDSADVHVNNNNSKQTTRPTGDHSKSIHSTSSTALALIQQRVASVGAGGGDQLDRKALCIAKRAARMFSVESEQIPAEAVCLYTATRSPTGHMSVVDVVACTMTVAHRRTAQDIEDVSLAFSIKVKNIACAIQGLQTTVLMGDATLASAYAYLFKNVGERRPNRLVDEAMSRFLEVAREDERAALSRASWGIRSLAEVMLKHIQDCRLVGGESLPLLARAIVVMSCELHGLMCTSADFIRSCILANHRATWKDALAAWKGGGGFDEVVAQKRRLREYGHVVKDQDEVEGEKPAEISQDCQVRRDVRARVTRMFEGDPNLGSYVESAVSAGVTHLCVSTVAKNETVRRRVQGPGGDDQLCSLVHVCLALVMNVPPPTDALALLVVGTRGCAHTVLTARRFKCPRLCNPGCFIRVGAPV